MEVIEAIKACQASDCSFEAVEKCSSACIGALARGRVEEVRALLVKDPKIVEVV